MYIALRGDSNGDFQSPFEVKVWYLCGKGYEGVYEGSEFFLAEHWQLVLLGLYLQFCENGYFSDSL